MDSASPPQPQHLLFKPLMISLVGIISTALVILTYNFIISRYCSRRSEGVPLLFQASRGNEMGKGVEKKVLEGIPVFVYTNNVVKQVHVECTICLGELEEGEKVRLLPNCKHVFHVHCIDEWFLSHANCPVCRSVITPVVGIPVDILVDIPVEEYVPEVKQLPSDGLLSHSVSLNIVPCERDVLPILKPSTLGRSFSMDNSKVFLKIKGKCEKGSSNSPSLSSSSSSMSGLSISNKARLYRGRSLGRLGRSSSMLMKSFGRPPPGHRHSNESLPL